MNCLYCPWFRRRKSPTEWQTVCGRCRHLTTQELAQIVWIQDTCEDRTVVAPIVFRLSRENSRRRYNALAPLLPKGETARLLEIGCNHDPILPEWAGSCYFGVDIRADFVSRAQAINPAGKFSVQNASTLAFKSGVFGAAVMLDVIEHIPSAQIPALISEVQRVLAPGGHLFLSSPDGTMKILKKLLGPLTEQSHVQEFLPQDVRRYCEEAGLRWRGQHSVEGLVLPDRLLWNAVKFLVAERPRLASIVGRATAWAGYRNWLYVFEKPGHLAWTVGSTA